MRRLLMMFALLAFVTGSVMSSGCSSEDKPKTDTKKDAASKDGDKKDADTPKKEDGASLDNTGDAVAMTNVGFDVTGLN